MSAAARSLGSHLLFKWRSERGLNQTQAAEQLGVPQTRISHFERGRRKPGLELAVRMEQRSAGEIPAAAWTMPAPSGGQQEVAKAS